MKIEHLTLTFHATAASSTVRFWLCLPQQSAVPLCCVCPVSGQWQSAACFPAAVDTPLFDDADLIALRSSLFLLGVADIDAPLAGLQLQAQQALAACGAAKAA